MLVYSMRLLSKISCVLHMNDGVTAIIKRIHFGKCTYFLSCRERYLLYCLIRRHNSWPFYVGYVLRNNPECNKIQD